MLQTSGREDMFIQVPRALLPSQVIFFLKQTETSHANPSPLHLPPLSFSQLVYEVFQNHHLHASITAVHVYYVHLPNTGQGL